MDLKYCKSNKDFNLACRVCLNHVNDGIELFSEVMESVDILDKINLCFQIILSPVVYLPNKMCKNCIDELTVAYNFRLKCVTIEERFDKYWKLKSENYQPTYTPKASPDVSTYFPPNYSFYEADSVEADSSNSITIDQQPHSNPSSDLNCNCKANSNTNDEKLKYFECQICKKILKTKTSLEKHKISMHSKRKHVGKVTGFGSSRLYHCKNCSYSTPHSQTLVNHMRRHDGERPYKCHCGKSFTQAASLTAHFKTHSNVSFYICTVCGKQFKHAYSLKKHLHVHEEANFSCSMCQKVLKSKESLQNHLHRHYNIRNFNCEDCGATFVTSSELINHKKSHSSVKNVNCHLCDYKTHSKKSLAIHLKRHAGDRPYKCASCDLTLYTQGDLHRHQRVHTKEKPFDCPTCSQRFTYSSSLNKHMLTVHGEVYRWGDLKTKESRKNKITHDTNTVK